MREILFRGYSEETLGMVKGNLHTIYGGIAIANSHGTYQVLPDTVGQYTGLKDKNGVRIFEGDIFEYSDGVPDQRYLIKWHTVGFEVYSMRNGKTCCLPGRLHHEHDYMVVVSNIHETEQRND